MKKKMGHPALKNSNLSIKKTCLNQGEKISKSHVKSLQIISEKYYHEKFTML